MGNQTIAILRRNIELVAVVSTRKFQLTAPRYGDSLTVDLYEERIVPLDEVTDLNRDRLLELQKHWERLAEVTDFDDSITADIKEVLGITIPDNVQPTVDPWRPPVEPKLPRATAAHPRAYRGTKTQPPSPPQVPVADLRPHLCNLRDLRAILEYVLSRDSHSESPARAALNAVQTLEIFAVPRPLRHCLWMVALCRRNSGRRNSGRRNSGRRNSGRRNSGGQNSGGKKLSRKELAIGYSRNHWTLLGSGTGPQRAAAPRGGSTTE